MDKDGSTWLREFEDTHNRPLRVLHYGNIANNGYLNAKALRKIGIHADVLSHDYYHIMGCPEWEDAEIVAPWGDDFAPDWSASTSDFELPEWFFRGTLDACLDAAFSLNSESPADQRPVSRKKKANIASFLRTPKASAYFVRNRGVLELLQRLKRLVSHVLNKLRFSRLGGYLGDASNNNAITSTRVAQVLDAMFPTRKGQAKAGEIIRFLVQAEKLRPLFDQYDIVQAYATTPILAWLSGVRPFVAYEHGTIRQLPFEETSDGVCLAGAYKQADTTIITNSDNKKAAQELGLSSYMFVPHPVNEEFLESGEASSDLRRRLQRDHDASFVLFHPARQHWSAQRDPSMEKGNDILIRGFARMVKEVDPRMLLVMVDWGQMVDESKALLKALDCSHRTIWIKPQAHRSFAHWINASDAIADQFYLGAFGSLTPKAMACGKPVLLNLNVEMHKWCFEEMPPVLNTKTPNEVFEALKRIVMNPEELRKIGAESRAWYQREHSMHLVAQRLVTAYEKAMKSGSDV